MPKKFKTTILQKMEDISLCPGIEVIDADHILPSFYEPLTEMRT
jgi:hypothetical protein